MDEMIKREKHRVKEANIAAKDALEKQEETAYEAAADYAEKKQAGGLTIVELKNDKLCKQIGIDPTKKEQYLSDAEFEKVMQMPRSDFNAMKGWKRAKLKKEAGL